MAGAPEIADEQLELDTKDRAEVAGEPSAIDQWRCEAQVNLPADFLRIGAERAFIMVPLESGKWTRIPGLTSAAASSVEIRRD